MSLLLLYRPRYGGGDTHDPGPIGHYPTPESLKKKAPRLVKQTPAKRVVLVNNATLERAQADFEQGKRDYDRIQAEILNMQEEIRLLKLAPPIDSEQDSRLLDDLRELEEQLKLIALEKLRIARALLDDEIIIMLLSDQEIH